MRETAVRWPSEASSRCTRRSWWCRKFASDAASPRVRVSTLSKRRTISIGVTAWSANAERVDLFVGEWVHGLRWRTMTPMGVPSRSSGTPSIVRTPLPPWSTGVPERPGHHGCERWHCPSQRGRQSNLVLPRLDGRHIGLHFGGKAVTMGLPINAISSAIDGAISASHSRDAAPAYRAPSANQLSSG